MKRFICSVLSVSVLFVGLGAVIERVGAAFRSDERAIAIVTRARTVIGSDNVRSMTIAAKSAKTVNLPDGQKVLDGDLDIALELPNRLNKSIRIGSPNGGGETLTTRAEVRTMKIDTTEPANIDGTRKIIVRKDGTIEGAGAGDKVMVFKGDDNTAAGPGTRRIVVEKIDDNVGTEPRHGDELLFLTLALLGRTPEGADVPLAYLGEGSVDGNTCDNVAAGTGETAIRICFDRASGFPRSASYMAPKPLVIKVDKASADTKDVRVFTTKMATPEMARYEVKFSDYRTVDGVQLPFSWTQTLDGKADDTVTVTSYAINPEDIASKFKNTNVVVVKKSEK